MRFTTRPPICYNVTHSHAMNIGNAKIIPVTPWWQKLLYTGAGLFFLLTVLGVVMWVRSGRKAKA